MSDGSLKYVAGVLFGVDVTVLIPDIILINGSVIGSRES